MARGTVYSIGLGTHADDAKHLAYADDMPFVDRKMAVRVGTTCRFCERTDCNQRRRRATSSRSAWTST
jgi:predicted transcriptional regulator